jgi:uncharacterized protein
MLTLISPAKDLAEHTPWDDALPYTQPRQLEEASGLLRQLKPLAPHQVSGLMGLSDKLGLLNYQRFQSWQPPFDSANAKPAALLFNGDVYQGLQAHTFTSGDWPFAQTHLRILSGLYGLLRPLDLIQPYRLEMGTVLANSRGRDLYSYWRQSIGTWLQEDLAQAGGPLVNLASQEYFKAVPHKTLQLQVIEPVFKDFHPASGHYKIISFYAKKARGQMSAYIVKNRIDQPEGLKGFNEAGYSFNAALSSLSTWVFTRRL